VRGHRIASSPKEHLIPIGPAMERVSVRDGFAGERVHNARLPPVDFF